MLTNEANAKLHGDFSTNLCQNALHDAFKRVCPVRAGGHECGCLSFLARMVMEHYVSRLDVTMFNTIPHDEIPSNHVRILHDFRLMTDVLFTDTEQEQKEGSYVAISCYLSSDYLSASLSQFVEFGLGFSVTSIFNILVFFSCPNIWIFCEYSMLILIFNFS